MSATDTAGVIPAPVHTSITVHGSVRKTESDKRTGQIWGIEAGRDAIKGAKWIGKSCRWQYRLYEGG